MKKFIIYISILLVCSCKSTPSPKKVVEEKPSFSFARCERVQNEIKVRLAFVVNHLDLNDSFIAFSPHLQKYLRQNFVDFLSRNKDENREITVEVLRNYLSYLDGFLSRTLTIEQRMRIYRELSQTFSMLEYSTLWYEDELYKPYQIKSFLCFAEGVVTALDRYKTYGNEREDFQLLAKPHQVDMSVYIKSKTGRYENPKKEFVPQDTPVDSSVDKPLPTDNDSEAERNLPTDWEAVPGMTSDVKETQEQQKEQALPEFREDENGVIDLSNSNYTTNQQQKFSVNKEQKSSVNEERLSTNEGTSDGDSSAEREIYEKWQPVEPEMVPWDSSVDLSNSESEE